MFNQYKKKQYHLYQCCLCGCPFTFFPMMSLLCVTNMSIMRILYSSVYRNYDMLVAILIAEIHY